MRHSIPTIFLSLPLNVLLITTAISACHQPSAMNVAYEKSIRSFLRRYYKRVCIGANCYCHENSHIPRNAGFTWVRGSKLVLRSPWNIPRGGGQQQQEHGTEVSSSQHKTIPLSSLPLIDSESVSLALRLTCETNRLLHRGTTVAADASVDSISIHPCQISPNGKQQLIPASCTTIRSVPEDDVKEQRRTEELTVFHSLDPREDNEYHGNSTERKHRQQALPWGPDLQSYLDTLLCAIGLDKDFPDKSNSSFKTHTPMDDEKQIILSLTVLYLDRSTSQNSPHLVNSLTGQQWYPHCPYLLPQTIHRLILTAMSIATKFVRGDTSVSNILLDAANSMLGEKQAISSIDMEKMEDWMLHAMRSIGGMRTQHHEMSSQISHEEISTLLRKWGEHFIR